MVEKPGDSGATSAASSQSHSLLHRDLTDRILKCAVTVHRALGPGLTEYSYQTALALEFAAQHVPFLREPIYAVHYRNVLVGWHKPDFVVEDTVIVELKAVTVLTPVFNKQLLTYLRVSGLRVGLLLNFNVSSMSQDRIRRLVL